MPYALTLPLELFVIVGSFVEELFSPIPAFAVFVPTGIVAAFQDKTFAYLPWLAVLAGIGKLPAALLLYALAHRLHARIVAKGQIMGFKRAQIKKASRYFGNTTKGWWSLFIAHALPIFPGLVLSLAGGFIAMDLRLFLTATFLGATISALIHIFIGYIGLEAFQLLQTTERISQIVLLAFFVFIAGWLLYNANHANR